jgi:hypothetical protein
VGSTNRRIKFQANPGIKVRPYLQSNQCKKSWDVVQVAEHLPSKCKALRSNPRAAKQKQKKKPFSLFFFRTWNIQRFIYQDVVVRHPGRVWHRKDRTTLVSEEQV